MSLSEDSPQRVVVVGVVGNQLDRASSLRFRVIEATRLPADAGQRVVVAGIVGYQLNRPPSLGRSYNPSYRLSRLCLRSHLKPSPFTNRRQPWQRISCGLTRNASTTSSTWWVS